MTMGLNMEASEEVACCTSLRDASDETVAKCFAIDNLLSLQCCLGNKSQLSLGVLHHSKIHL